MTTVVATRELLCGDKQSTDLNGRKSTCTKIRKKNGCIIGFCGALTDGEKFCRAWPNVQDLQLDEDFEALVLCEKGLLHYDQALVPIRVLDKYYAIGTGGDLALAAMMAGATPQQAVKIAGKLDAFTGQRVHTVKLFG